VQLRFRVRFALSAGKTTVHISNKSDGPGANAGAHPYDFYCGAWMGGANPHMDFRRLEGRADGTGEAGMCVPLLSGDVDVLKLGLYVRDPATSMMRHVVSGFQSLSWLSEGLAEASDCDKATKSMVLKDNYTPNQALLRFGNDATDLSALAGLLPGLRASVLHDNAEINSKVTALSYGLHDFLEQVSNVSNANGGSNFVNSLAFTESMGCAINYPLLDRTYSSERHRAPLAMLAYMALATVHYVGQSPEALLKLSDGGFVNEYVVPLCTSFTVCPHTAVYSGDETVGETGQLNLGTEDFAMVMSHHYYEGVRSPFVDAHGAGELQGLTNDALAAHIAGLRARASKAGSDGHFLIADDCETLSGLIKSIEGAVYKYHLESAARAAQGASAHVGAPGEPGARFEGQDRALAQMMWDETRGMQNLSAVPMEDFAACAQLLGRYGRLRHNCALGKGPCAQMGLSVVSAKGPSFSLANRELNGHACVVAQTIGSDGLASYSIAEGTSKMIMRNLPAGCPREVTLGLTTGPKKFGMSEALGIIAVNMADYVKTFGKTRVGEVIPHTFEGVDPYAACPFYMAGFFVGLEMNSCTPGVVAMENRTSAEDRAALVTVPLLKESGAVEITVRAEALRDEVVKPGRPSAPMFGAPLVGLSSERVRAVPVDLGKIFGEEGALHLLSQLTLRDSETYPPMAAKRKLMDLMSFWSPLAALDVGAAKQYDPERMWLNACSESFLNADEHRAVLEHKTRLAREFNAAQAKDPKSDGVRMSVMGQMLSVVCHFYIPLPRRDLWELTCARSMQLALTAVPSLAGQPSGPDGGKPAAPSTVSARFSTRLGVF
jgi:hypothetical protein